MRASYVRKSRILLVFLCLALMMASANTVQAETKAPAKPVITSAKVLGNAVQLKWQKAKGASSYKVFVQTGSDGWKYWKKVKATSKNRKKYADTLKYKLKKSGKKYKVYKRKNPYKAVKTVTGLKYTYTGKYSTTYRFVLQAKNGKKSSKYSSVKTVSIPAKPQTDTPEDTEVPEDPVPEDPPVISYTVTFLNDVTGEVIDTKTVVSGNKVTFPDPPEMDDYIFEEWNTPVSVLITADRTIKAIYRAKKTYTITCIDGTTNEVFKTINVKEGDSVPEPDYPRHYYDDKNPWRFYCWSDYKAFDTPIYSDKEVTAQYDKLYNINWIDIYDGSIIKTDKVLRAESGSAPQDYPSHIINGVTVTANDFVGYDDTSGDSKRNYKNASDDKCDSPDARVISMYVIYPDVTHKIRIISSLNSDDVCSTFYVIDGGDGTDELIARSEGLGVNGYRFTGFTDEAGNPVSSLRNVRSDMDIIANFQK